jgi:hypothetical protein
MKKQIFALASVVMIAGALTITSCNKEDITAPVITVTGGNSITHTLNSTFTAPSATATDDEDGDLTASISVSDNVNEDLVGSYTVTYTVSDAAGNTATETVTVDVVNSAAYLVGSYTNAYDTCQSGVASTFDATISADAAVNNKIFISNFGAFGPTITIIGNVSGSTISFPGSQTLGGSASLVTASGNITNMTDPTFTVAYTWTDGSSTEVCTTIYNKD